MTVKGLAVKAVASPYRRPNTTLPFAAPQGLLPQAQMEVFLQDHFWRADRSAVAQASCLRIAEDLEVKLVAGGAP